MIDFEEMLMKWNVIVFKLFISDSYDMEFFSIYNMTDSFPNFSKNFRTFYLLIKLFFGQYYLNFRPFLCVTCSC